VVKELPENKVAIRQKENQWVEVSSGKSLFNIMGISAETFPTLPPYEEEDFIAVKSEILREMIDKTIFSVSADESRYNLTGVYLTKKEGEKEIRMVATDGYRLSLIDRPIGAMIAGLEEGILLPKKGLAELNKMLHEDGEEISIKMKQNNCLVKKNNTILIMRLLDAEFPDYRQVIPPNTRRQIVMGRTQVLESLRRVSILSSEKTKGVKFHFMKDTLQLSSYNPDIGEAKEELAIEYKGEDIIVGFNARFILDVLNILNSDQILFDLEDGVSPSVIRPTDDEGHTCVVMPMRI
jgi:DNA polymerase-3 subunit beta